MSTPRNLEIVDETPVAITPAGPGMTYVEALAVSNLDAAVAWIKIWHGAEPAHASDTPHWEQAVAASENGAVPVLADFPAGCWIAVGANPGADATGPTTGCRITVTARSGSSY